MIEQIERIQRINNSIDRIKNLYVEMSRRSGQNYYRNYILYILAYTDVCHQSDISSFYELPKTTVNGTILSMQKDGLVTMEKDPQDARSKVLKLTDKGKQEAETADVLLKECQKVIAERMPAERLQMLESTLNEYEMLLKTGIRETGNRR